MGTVDMRTQSSVDCYETPQWLVSEIREYFGGFIDLDPCTSDRNPTGALEFYTEQDDGLAKPWYGNVYVNSPFGRQLPLWVAKCDVEESLECIEQIIQLAPARFGSQWFKKAARSSNGVLVLNKRLAFTLDGKPVLDKKGKPCTAQFDTALFHYGQGWGGFKRHFKKHATGWHKAV